MPCTKLITETTEICRLLSTYTIYCTKQTSEKHKCLRCLKQKKNDARKKEKGRGRKREEHTIMKEYNSWNNAAYRWIGDERDEYPKSKLEVSVALRSRRDDEGWG